MNRLSGVVGSSQMNGRHRTASANTVKRRQRVGQGGVMRRGCIGGGGAGRVGRGRIEGRRVVETRRIDRRHV